MKVYTKIRRGFTLIELLVVIAIVVILASMLLPVLSRAKMRAKWIICVNNNKQMAAAWMLYVTDNIDLVPGNGDNSAPSPNLKRWVQGSFVNPTANTTTEYVLSPKYAQFAAYIRNHKTYVCPEEALAVTVGGVVYAKIRSYSLNAYVGWLDAWDTRQTPVGGSPVGPLFRIFKKQSEMSAMMPMGTFLFMDVNSNSICGPAFGMKMDVDSFFTFPGSPHRRRAVASFSDGHVESHKWEDQRTITAFSTSYHSHGESSPGNKDLLWLRERTTVRR